MVTNVYKMQKKLVTLSAMKTLDTTAWLKSFSPRDFKTTCVITLAPGLHGISEVMTNERARKINLDLAREIMHLIETAQCQENVEIIFASDIKRYIRRLSEKGLGALVVTDKFEIEVPFYQLQIALPPLAKAIYILYMRHSEGLYRKQIANDDIAEELYNIYRILRPNSTAEHLRKTISDLTDFSKKNLDRQMTLINHRFKKALGEHAKHYLPTGAHKSQPRSLDFTRVTFRLPPALENLSSTSGEHPR